MKYKIMEKNMRNLSGNYNTTNVELDIVKQLFDNADVPYTNIRKCSDADAGDIVVTAYGKDIIIEVKEENYKTRFCIYRQLGFDYLSVFHLKPNVNRNKWRGVKKPYKYFELESDIDTNTKLKKGKIFYSDSHLWLFFSLDEEEIKYSEFFKGKDIVNPIFRDYLFTNCEFAVNDKPIWQDSYRDNYLSAVIYVNANDKFLNQYKVYNLNEFIQNIED